MLDVRCKVEVVCGIEEVQVTWKRPQDLPAFQCKMDVSGKIPHTIMVEGNKDRKIWNTSHLNPGLYIFSCHVRGHVKSGKFMINR